MTESTDKIAARILSELLTAHGIERVVISPGSRNAPLIVALSRNDELECPVVIDERSAAFSALGMSLQSGRPVGVCCTSGTALLNYAPAVAEAYYRGIPLIVISADRPEEWIDQDDSQTLWQQDALAPYVKRRCDIGARLDFPNGEWWVNRVINDALLEAVSGRPGPVHINIRLDAPLNRMTEPGSVPQRVITEIAPTGDLTTARARELGEFLASPRRVMFVAGFHTPDNRLNKALGKMAALPNVAVLTETIANLHNPLFISRIDSTLSRLTPEQRESMMPDTVITLGGALVSRHIKEWIRSLPPTVRHWHVGVSHTTVDCFGHLSMRIEMEPSIFMRQLASAMQIHRKESDYAMKWQEAAHRAAAIHDQKVEAAPWSDLKALAKVFAMIPRDWNLHLSNGTPIRYAQLMDCSHIHRTDCNRGVSGIDGCTSTALGASAVYRGTTLLISGDMSFQYDISALSSSLMNGRMKMIVVCNGGGGIFRFIGATRSLPELDQYLSVGTNLPLKGLCDAYGISYFKAESEEELEDSFIGFSRESANPALLAIHTSGRLSAEILTDYFK
ncbi:MAG: 2-succinyl-5-enolpyruvyl-6-hydroxy-3-cyclohexene-1-carboxylic-acid synthase [Muribaculaceae bacterium]|nr:2-succinyl-5-enolpyruvyl-6-hydroxy-3-cyclohexene-1-carboxylic-acid synthase [Muribaculaceae bacterium]